MKTLNHVSIELDGKEGLFRTQKSVSLFLGHTVKVELEHDLKIIKKEITKMIKAGECRIDLFTMDKDCRRTDKIRMIPVARWTGEFELDYRVCNGYDFSDSKVYNFTSLVQMVNYVMKELTKFIDETMGELPEDRSWYQQLIDDQYIPENVAAIVTR